MRYDVTIGRIVVDGVLRDRRAFAASLERAIRTDLAAIVPPVTGDANPVRDAVADAVVQAAAESSR